MESILLPRRIKILLIFLCIAMGLAICSILLINKESKNEEAPLDIKTMVVRNVYSKFLNPSYKNSDLTDFNSFINLTLPNQSKALFLPFYGETPYHVYLEQCAQVIPIQNKNISFYDRTLIDNSETIGTRKEIIDCINTKIKTNFVDPQQIELLASSIQFAVLKDMDIQALNQILDQVKLQGKMTIAQGLKIVKIYEENKHAITIIMNEDQEKLAVQKL